MAPIFRGFIIGLICVASLTDCAPRIQSQTTGSDPRLIEFLKPWAQRGQWDDTTRYYDVLADLNGDGSREAIVFLSGRGWCGSGGCHTLILSYAGSSYRLVADIPATYPPIRVLKVTGKGWRDIGVWTEGGGIEPPGRESSYSFDGSTYVRDAAVRPRDSADGEIVIPKSAYLPENQKLLFP
jgi:hypothetical protein